MWIIETSFIEKTVLSHRQQHHLNAIAAALGFSYEVKFPSDEEGRDIRLVNGTFKGMFGMLQRLEVDMIIGGFPHGKEVCEEFRSS